MHSRAISVPTLPQLRCEVCAVEQRHVARPREKRSQYLKLETHGLQKISRFLIFSFQSLGPLRHTVHICMFRSKSEMCINANKIFINILLDFVLSRTQTMEFSLVFIKI
jgi:hypothetical protein